MDRKTERRRRLKRPVALTVFGIFFLVFPFVNFFYIAGQTGYRLSNPLFLLLPGIWPVSLFMVAAFIVGLGLLKVKRWGWRLFLTFALCLIAYNLLTIIIQWNAYNIGSLLRSILAIAAVLYFCQKDVSAPYFKMYPRGWRMEKRRPVQISLTIDTHPFITRDFSPSGFYVDWEDCADFHLPGDSVEIIILIENEQFDFEGGVVRMDENGAGIALRNMNREKRKKLRTLIRKSLNKIPDRSAA